MVDIYKSPNPFYIPLVLVGLLFCITACAFGVMTVKGLQPAAADAASTESGREFMSWIDENGFRLMMIELGALAVLTFAAIGTDTYWTERQKLKQVTESGDGN